MSQDSINLRNTTIGKIDSEWNVSFMERVKSANESSIRVRYAFLLSTMLSLGLSLVMYNYFFTWNRSFASTIHSEIAQHHKPLENPMRAQVIIEWMSTQTYQLPILGIKIMASDLPLLGPIAFILISTWVFFNVRREHFTTARLLSDVYIIHKANIVAKNPSSIVTVQTIYHLIIGQTVLNVINYDLPVRSLEESFQSGKKIDKQKNKFSSALQSFIRKLFYVILIWSPFLSILFLASIRLITIMWVPSAITNKSLNWEHLSNERKIILIVSIFSVFTGLLVCARNSVAIIKFNKATRKLLDDFQYWAWNGDLLNK